MEYKERYLENGELKFKNNKQIDQSNLTSDCWMIQINGLITCKTCEFEHTEHCGGGLTLLKLQVSELNKSLPEGVKTSIRKGINFDTGKDNWSPRFKVKHQEFSLEPRETELKAVWLQKQFLVAINNLIEMIKEDK